MAWVGFEPTIPAFELAKTVHVLGRAVTVVGVLFYTVTLTIFGEEYIYYFVSKYFCQH
jgi:hypothetical protein